jgi:uncharacterized protein
MSKSDFLLKDGKITLQFLPRIEPSNTSFGTGYAERTKKISHLFREEFNKAKANIEQPDYFKEQLLYNYLYKGPVLEWYMRIKVRMEKNYALFNEMVPKQGRILDIGCGYGFMTYMLHFVSTQRLITGVDYDEQKIATANHCFSKNENIHFICADILQYALEQYIALPATNRTKNSHAKMY